MAQRVNMSVLKDPRDAQAEMNELGEGWRIVQFQIVPRAQGDFVLLWLVEEGA